MSPMSIIITSTAPPSFVSHRKVPSSKNPDPGSRLCAPVPKCTIPFDTRVRNPTRVQCSAQDVGIVYALRFPMFCAPVPKGSAQDWMVRSTSGDVATVAAGELTPGRRWRTQDVGTIGVILATHALTLLAPFYFTWGALWVAVGLWVATGLFGLTLSFHRHLTHRSFKVPKWLEYAFAYCGTLALQGSPIDWVSTHKYHHMYCDSNRDPHTPIHGFWFSHLTWMFDQSSFLDKCGGQTNVEELQRQPFYTFLQRTYLLHHLGLGLLLYSLGGLPFLVWGMGVRIVWVSHSTWFVGSACHIWGNRVWNTRDLSRNNWWVGILAFGEGWHNNHHAFVYSARHGLEWWQVDMTWYVIKFLQVIGLATDVKLPSEADKQRLALN